MGWDIHINAFGPGLKINHYGLIVVNANARIGAFCDIHQGVNIGQHGESQWDVPTIGDNVWIGPGAKIFGRVNIPSRCAIGANAVVNKSFEEENITIAGIPAVKLSDSGNPYIKNMIPKKIHYCWFGGRALPTKVIGYIDTWKKYLPDCEIKQWDESNFDINARIYTRQAYYANKYAFVSDVARLHALEEEGGIYLDTDILIKRPFPLDWFKLDGFGSFEHNEYVETGLIASTKGSPIIRNFLRKYDTIPFFKGLTFDMTTNVNRFTKYMKECGFEMNNQEQTINGFTLFPQQLLCGKDWQTGRYDDESTYAVHDYTGTWGKEVLTNPLKFIISSALYVIKWHCKQQ